MGVNTLEDWTAAVCAEVGIAGPIDRDVVLDLTRDVAHGVARPAAPLTAYLIGLAAGASDDPGRTTAELAARIGTLAREWGHRADGDAVSG